MLTCLAYLRAYVPACLACLRAHVSCILTCSRTLRAYALPYQCALHALMLTCQCGLGAYVLHVSTCLACLCTHVSTWFASSRATMPYASCLTRLAWPRDHQPRCLASSVSSFDATFFSFAAILVELVHTVGNA